MTGQIADKFMFKGEEYYICGITGGEIFSPEDFDLQPYSTSSNCWRGYQIYYNVINNQLVGETLFINLEEEDEIINDKKPIILGKPDFNKTGIEANWNFFKYYYQDLDLKLKFTGRVMVAKDFIEEMSIHMGFQKPMGYRIVFELIFEEGKLAKEIDKSKVMAQRREELFNAKIEPKSRKDKKTEDWISDSFNLDYEPDEE